MAMEIKVKTYNDAGEYISSEQWQAWGVQDAGPGNDYGYYIGREEDDGGSTGFTLTRGQLEKMLAETYEVEQRWPRGE